MFEIKMSDAGKRYNREWIFRGANHTFQSGKTYAILGGNGSGKSTFIRSLIGYVPLTEGAITYKRKGENLNRSFVYKHVSFCSPYLELYEELTLKEMSGFHFSLKPALPGISIKDFSTILDLDSARDKPVHHFSSGMKQRLRIGLALLSDTDVVFLDEPTSNLDRKGEDWYNKTLQEYRKNRMIIVASNHKESEYLFCDGTIEMGEYKPAASKA